MSRDDRGVAAWTIGQDGGQRLFEGCSSIKMPTN